jgi:hypothetical protein
MAHFFFSLPHSVMARLVRAIHFFFRENWIARIERAMTKYD